MVDRAAARGGAVARLEVGWVHCGVDGGLGGVGLAGQFDHEPPIPSGGVRGRPDGVGGVGVRASQAGVPRPSWSHARFVVRVRS